MATATLVEAGANRLRYLIAAEGTGDEQVTITTTGAASPDTRTDSIGSGPIKLLSKVVDQGYGQFAAGAQTQAKARALWLSDWSGADPGNENIVTAICRLTARAMPTPGVGEAGAVDANVDGGGNPTIVVNVFDGSTVYLDIEVPGTIGD